MTITQLRVFYTTALAGSIAAGARLLFMSRTTVVSHLRALEKDLGVKLYQTDRRGHMTLTNVGEMLLRRAESLVRIEEEIRALASSHGRGRARAIYIGASNTGTMYMIPPIVREFRRRSGAEVKLAIGNSNHLIEMVTQGILDWALASGPLEGRRIHSRRLAQEELVLIAAPTLGKLPEEPVPIDQLLTEFPVIVPGSATRTRFLVESRLAELGITPKKVMALEDTESVKKAVEAELGVAFVSPFAVELEVATGRLRVLKVESLFIARTVELVWRRGTSLGGLGELFLECAEDWLRRHPALARRDEVTVTNPLRSGGV